MHERSTGHALTRAAAPQLDRAPLCPLCGEPNGCVPASCGNFDGPCWCEQAAFVPALLARVPERLKNAACICWNCARPRT